MKFIVIVVWSLGRWVRNTAKWYPLSIKEVWNYRGKDYTAYLMSRDFFSLLAMRFQGTKALEWQGGISSPYHWIHQNKFDTFCFCLNPENLHDMASSGEIKLLIND